jgi:hypothetical protein
VIGFFLNHYVSDFPEAWSALQFAFHNGSIKVGVDPTIFKGIEKTKDAVQHLIVRW